MISRKENPDHRGRFLGLFYLALLLVILARIYETSVLHILFNPPKLIKSEAMGLLKDLLLCSGIFAFLWFLYHKLSRSKGQNKMYLFDIAIVALVIGHLSILEYFFYQMEPLDVFVFGHTPDEMAFSLKTSNVSYARISACIFITMILLGTGLYYSKRIRYGTGNFKWIIRFGFAAALIYIIIDVFGKFPVASDLIKNKSFYFYSNIIKDRWDKVFVSKQEENSDNYQALFKDQEYTNSQFPFLHRFKSKNDLGKYLGQFQTRPNITILLTESLSEYFIHPIRGISFMPFLDSLSKVSLYWPNHLSLGERSFAANPAIQAAVPYGEIGFSLMEIYPYHFSLINVLRKNNYYTSFYYGQGSWFHNKKHFYNFNDIDRIIDKNSFDAHFEKVLVGDEQNFWGYNDFELFQQYILATDSLTEAPRLDILFTGTSHSPFSIKHPEVYNRRFEDDLKNVNNPEDRDHFIKYKKFYLSLYNVDDAYRGLFDKLRQRPDYEQTVFILTGDHAMTELPRMNALHPYKVPLVIYSPKLKHAEKFEAVCSHNDIYESLLSYLSEDYQLNVPEYSTSLGNKLKFNHEFDQRGTFVFMNNNRQIADIYSDGYFLHKDRYLFKVYEDLEIYEIIDPVKLKELRKKLYAFKSASSKSSEPGGLLPDSLFFKFMNKKVLNSAYYPDSVFNLSTDQEITQIKNITSGEYTLDLSMEVISDPATFPQIEISLNHNDNTEWKLALNFPIEKTKYQFHQKFKCTSPPENNSKLMIRFINPDQDEYSFKSLKYTFYKNL